MLKTNVLDFDCEIHLFSMIPGYPNLFRWQCVCKRWRQMILNFPLKILSFERKRLRGGKDQQKHLVQAIQTWPTLVSLDFGEITISSIDVVSAITTCLPHLETLIIPRLTLSKGLESILSHSLQLKVLQVSSVCRLNTSQLNSLSLVKLYLTSNSFLTPLNASRLCQACGHNLKELSFAGASSLTSQFLHPLASSCDQLTHLTLSQCGYMKEDHIKEFLWHAGSRLEWLDLSYCNGFRSITVHPLLQLKVLLLDATGFDDIGCQDLALNARKLEILSLKNCTCITDTGIFSIAMACPDLMDWNLSGTKITGNCLESMETNKIHIDRLRLDSCRGIPLRMRKEYALKFNKTSSTTTTLSSLLDAKTSLLMWENSDQEQDEDYKEDDQEQDEDYQQYKKKSKTK